jgi:hypothetical protein
VGVSESMGAASAVAHHQKEGAGEQRKGDDGVE